MKNILISLLLLAGMARNLSAVSAADSSPEGCLMNAGAYTVALNNVSATVNSSSIDLDGYVGLFINMTATGQVLGGLPLSVQVMWNSVTYTAYQLGETYPPGSWCVKRKARYAIIHAIGFSGNTAPKITAWYALGSPAVVSLSLTPIPTPGTTPAPSGYAGSAGQLMLHADIQAVQTQVATQITALNVLTGTASNTTYFSVNAVTYASGVMTTSYWYLTPSTHASLFLDNTATAGTPGTFFFVLTNSATPPVNTATVRQSLAPGEKLTLSTAIATLSFGDTYLHWINANSSTPTAKYAY